MTTRLGTRVFFTAIAQNEADEPVGGVQVAWRANDLNGENMPISQDGQFTADRPGSFVITAQAGTHTQKETVTVTVPAAAHHAPVRFARAADREPGWDDKRLRTAFAEGNRRGTNPVHSRLSIMVRSLRDLPELAAAGSSNFQLTVPVLDLPGRGLNLTLDLVYNSRVWHKSVDDQGISSLSYDLDVGWPAPGWSLGFSKLVRVGDHGDESMLVDADGTRHPFRTVRKEVQGGVQTFSGQTTDGTLIDYSSAQTPQEGDEITSAQVSYPNGTVVGYGVPGHAPVDPAGLSGAAEIYPASIMDVNGNYITITYRGNTGPEIETITDTLGRLVSFHYDAQNLLTAITGSGLDGGMRTLIRLHYVHFALAASLNFGRGMAFAVAIDPPVRDHYSLIDAIYYPATATGYWFSDGDSFSEYGLVRKVSEHRGMGLTAASLTEQGTVTAGTASVERGYDYPLQADKRLTDAPAYTAVTETWADMDTKPAVTTYTVQLTATPRRVEVTRSDGQRRVELSYNKPSQFDDGLVYQSETYDASPPGGEGKLLQKTSLTWEQGDYGSARVLRAEITDELGQAAVTEYDYGPAHNQVTEVREYDYGGLSLIRRTHIDYMTGLTLNAFTSSHIFDLPTMVQIYEGREAQPLSRTEYGYDNIQGLVDTPGVTAHFSNPFGPFVRPNVTQITRYGGAADLTGPVTENRRYDVTGNLVAADTAGSVRNYSFTLATQYAYPTAVTRGAANPNSPDRVTSEAIYDFNTGLPTSATDVNGQTTQLTYDPGSLRPTKVVTATSASTAYDYDNTALTLTITTRDSAGALAGQRVSVVNGRGLMRYAKVLNATRREIIQQPDGSFLQQEVPFSWDIVNAHYDAVGRLSKQSQPMRISNDGALALAFPPSTEISYDALNRVTKVRTAEGSEVRVYHNEAARPSGASSTPASTTRLVNAWGHERWLATDALGRLTQVIEPNPNASGSVLEADNIGTFYSYNALDRLVQVVQPPRSQNRVFRYDSLGRLTHQYLPEKGSKLNDAGRYGGIHGGGVSWSDVFLYDDQSNLVAHIDSRGVWTNYYYNEDPLNRLHRVAYDTSGFGDTANPILPAPSVDYEYMTTGDVTRIRTVTTAGVITEQRSYDEHGRLTSKTQILATRPESPQAIGYRYDSLDRLSEIQYPAEYGTGENRRRLIQYEYDVAGRLSAVTADGALYASQIQYNSATQIASLTVGIDGPLQLTETYDYDAATGLLQRQRVQRAGSPLLDLSYDYLLTPPALGKPSGRSGRVTQLMNNLDERRTQDYQYDTWGRLIGVTSANQWSQQYTYDRYGNRNSVTTSANDIPVPRDGFETLAYNTKTNHITTAGFAYDDAGNQTYTPHADGSRRHQYDAAGRLVKITDDAGQTVEAFAYGPDNRRVTTHHAATGKATHYVWDANTVITEYSSDDIELMPDIQDRGPDSQWARSYVYLDARLLATLRPHAPVLYHHPDRLGTRLFATQADATVMEQATLPFGVALDAESSAGITDVTNLRFTSYDRSTATGLDYALNRFYDSAQGRFTQADPLGAAAARLDNPQSLNLYSYVGNDPINLSDPAGLDWTDPSTGIGYIGEDIVVIGDDRDEWRPVFDSLAQGPLNRAGHDWARQDASEGARHHRSAVRRGPVDTDNRAYERLVKPYLDMKGPRPTSQLEKLMIAYWGVWALVGAAAVGGLGIAGSAVGLSGPALSSGIAGGGLPAILSALQAQYSASQPTSLAAAFDVVQRATSSLGYEVGIATEYSEAGIVLQNVGGIVTQIGASGTVLVINAQGKVLLLLTGSR